MDWKIRVNGNKDEAREAASIQCDMYMGMSKMTAWQKSAVLKAIDDHPGDGLKLSGFLSGNSDGTDVIGNHLDQT